MNSELQKHTLNLYRGDFQRLGELYPELSAASALRLIIRKHIEQQDEQQLADGRSYKNKLVDL